MLALLREMCELSEFVAPKGRDDDDDSNNHFGLMDKENIKLTKEMLKQLGFSYTTDYNMGITYFHFESKAQLDMAYKQTLKTIDTSKEDDLGNV